MGLARGALCCLAPNQPGGCSTEWRRPVQERRPFAALQLPDWAYEEDSQDEDSDDCSTSSLLSPPSSPAIANSNTFGGASKKSTICWDALADSDDDLEEALLTPFPPLPCL